MCRNCSKRTDTAGRDYFLLLHSRFFLVVMKESLKEIASIRRMWKMLKKETTQSQVHSPWECRRLLNTLMEILLSFSTRRMEKTGIDVGRFIDLF